MNDEKMKDIASNISREVLQKIDFNLELSPEQKTDVACIVAYSVLGRFLIDLRTEHARKFALEAICNLALKIARETDEFIKNQTRQ